MLILPTAPEIIFQALIPGAGTSGTKLDTAYLEFNEGSALVVPEEDLMLDDSQRYYERSFDGVIKHHPLRLKTKC
jgi:hypothetical protein